MGALRPTGLSSSAFSTRYLMEHNANVATVGPANILRRRPEVNIYAAFRISKSVECVVVPEFLRTLVFARPRGDDQFADCTFSPSLDMSR